jgi:hypothetical protein
MINICVNKLPIGCKPIMNITYDNIKAIQYIQAHRCNAVLDLNKRIVPSALWRSIEQLIITNAISPPIEYINLSNSNITEKDVDHRLHGIINL